ncbi:TetR/AcrR family transcriptional regulator [Streptomyces noursei]|uniref:TetR/AcrR family transcriptional regulator n=1 Tax=Streptomyces noursei TaxID=1971 RepID=UPI00167A2EBA|nr:TetR/AcrR family transcriptional regulator [Streptomyces noursei]MCZ1016675.1 helix-turn-helix domain containing protein [Streptomyces noursei]GGX39060.1 TetR family transcriptional regulator [Streptomyces noursei]
MHIQGSQWSAAATMTAAASDGVNGAGGNGTGAATGLSGRSTPLRVDAQRNLEHVLRAAREVFGELGYGAPMEDVARRARVGVGTVYRRFPSKDVLVRRIAEEETSRLTEQARAALGQEDDPWSALARFLRTSVASGAGRLLPPGILRVGASEERADGAAEPRVPEGRAEARVPLQRMAPGEADGPRSGPEAEETPGGQALLDVVGRLVERARAAGALRTDVTVSDVLLVIATGAPALPDPGQQQAASARLLEILLEGLRSRPAT